MAYNVLLVMTIHMTCTYLSVTRNDYNCVRPIVCLLAWVYVWAAPSYTLWVTRVQFGVDCTQQACGRFCRVHLRPLTGVSHCACGCLSLSFRERTSASKCILLYWRPARLNPSLFTHACLVVEQKKKIMCECPWEKDLSCFMHRN